MKNTIKDQKGIALITTLMLLVLAFAVVAILFRLATRETQLARLEQSYATALDAAKSGADLFMFVVQNGLYAPSAQALPFNASFNNVACLRTKMGNAPGDNPPGTVWTTAGCPSSAVDSNATDSPDITVALNNYTVSVKVIDTFVDNTKSGITTPGQCNNGCTYYTVLSTAVSPVGGQRADISFVYRYDQ